MAVEHNGILLLAIHVDDLFLLGDGGERLVDNLQRVQGLRCGVELAEPAVDQQQVGKRFLFVA